MRLRAGRRSGRYAPGVTIDPGTTSLAIPLAEGAGDAARRRGLRRMKALALSLLVLAALIYLITRDQDGVLGYVNAGAEAAMVGAIADWFAVTALFRHPLRLPIPHTAIIPNRKESLGASLQEFVAENFLREEVVRERIVTTQVAARVGCLDRRWRPRATSRRHRFTGARRRPRAGEGVRRRRGRGGGDHPAHAR